MTDRRWLAAGTVLSAWLYLRRQAQRWGATDEEADRHLPGDEIIPRPVVQTTHAVTVDAPPVRIWPWLVQMGYGRAEWYMEGPFHRMEKLFWRLTVDEAARETRAAVTSPRRIVPELQALSVGDVVPDGPPGSAFFTVKRLEPNRLLALYSDSHLGYLTPAALARRFPALASHGEFTWNFWLEPTDDEATRLILRMRANLGPAVVRLLMATPPSHVVEILNTRMMLNGIKARAEAHHS